MGLTLGKCSEFIIDYFTKPFCFVLKPTTVSLSNNKGIYRPFSNSSKPEVAEFTVSSSLNLVEVCLDGLYFQDGIDLICLAIKLLFLSVQQWQNSAVDSQTDDKAQGKRSLKESCIHQLLKKLGSKLKKELHHEMPDYYKSEALSRELKVR